MAATATPSPVARAGDLPQRAPQAPSRGAGGSAPRAAASGLRAALPIDRWPDLGIPLSVLGIVVAMIVPLPPWMLDILISTNIMLSTVVLLVAMYITKPVEFSVFPTTLLLLTLFRLALNISSSRLILMNGNAGTSAAGEVIEAFGNFVVGGSFIIGMVIFLVLIAIQYVVINHGAVRISEVTARFTLDALPGKQMSIDSDLNAGLIDESEAKTRRRQLSQEAEFYGSMDGASRFTQRDAVASILITGINIIAGFLIGVLQHNMDLSRAFKTYTVMTIGDGLVTVIPALMISISGGLIITRAGSDTQLGPEFQRQVFSNPQPRLLSSGVLVAMALLPGLPKIPFLVMGGALATFAWRLRQKLAAPEPAPAAAPAASAKDSIESLFKVDLLAVEVGLGLVKLVEGGSNSPLLRRIAAIRRQLAADLGFLLPPVRVTDNLSLKAREYTILLKGIEIARYEIPAGCELALFAGSDPTANPPDPGGMPTREPAFGIKAWWIPSDRADHARALGFTVVDSTSVLGTHLAELIRRHAHELFTRQEAKKVLDRVAEENGKVVEDLVPKLLPLAVVQRVLQNLLRERVSIRDAVSILEALGEAANLTRNPVLLTEYVRQSIRRAVVRPYLNPAGELMAWFLDPQWEQVMEGAVEHTENSSHLNLAPQRVREILDRLERIATTPESPLVIVTGTQTRPFLRQIGESSLANLCVLSHGEIPPGVRVVSLGVIQ
ncbi:MAG: flagellar biosynthesis protein FlhA [Bryobacter sp.]|nr:flagellar biosynthesis protein FlhA [Bryobacter sp.]